MNGNREKSRLGRLIRCFAAIFAIVALAEGLLWIFGPSFAPSVVRNENGGYYYLPGTFGVYRDFESGRLMPFRVNRFGARDSGPLPQAGERLIVVIGNSFVDARQVPEQERFTAILERKLREAGLPTRVMNFGIQGQNIVNYIDNATYLSAVLKPDLVIVGLSNDPDFTRTEQTTFRENRRISYSISNGRFVVREQEFDSPERAERLLKQVIRYSWLARIAFETTVQIDVWLGQFGTPAVAAEACPLTERPESRGTPDSFRFATGVMGELHRAAGDHLLVVQIPTQEQVEKNPVGCAWDAPERWAQAYASQQGIHLVQVLPALRRADGSPYFPHGHLNERGHEAVADDLFRQIRSAWGPG